jgi:hypothetical protein
MHRIVQVRLDELQWREAVVAAAPHWHAERRHLNTETPHGCRDATAIGDGKPFPAKIDAHCMSMRHAGL